LQGKNFVWVVSADNKTTQRPVTLGESVGDSVSILEGLKPGERIVVEGLQKVRQDAPVQPMTAGQVAQAETTNTLSKTGRE
jgi:multidrug efflux pump subunit AcrA (membrane-fusion protein)